LSELEKHTLFEILRYFISDKLKIEKYFSGYITYQPVIGLLDSKNDTIKLFGLHCLIRLCIMPKKESKSILLWKDLAINDGVNKLINYTACYSDEIRNLSLKALDLLKISNQLPIKNTKNSYFEDIYVSKNNWDVLIRIESKSVQAHKVILGNQLLNLIFKKLQDLLILMQCLMEI